MTEISRDTLEKWIDLLESAYTGEYSETDDRLDEVIGEMKDAIGEGAWE